MTTSPTSRKHPSPLPPAADDDFADFAEAPVPPTPAADDDFADFAEAPVPPTPRRG